MSVYTLECVYRTRGANESQNDVCYHRIPANTNIAEWLKEQGSDLVSLKIVANCDGCRELVAQQEAHIGDYGCLHVEEDAGYSIAEACGSGSDQDSDDYPV